MVDAFGTENIRKSASPRLVRENFSLTPKGIIEALDFAPPDLQNQPLLRTFWLALARGLHLLGAHDRGRLLCAKPRALGSNVSAGVESRARAVKAYGIKFDT